MKRRRQPPTGSHSPPNWRAPARSTEPPSRPRARLQSSPPLYAAGDQVHGKIHDDRRSWEARSVDTITGGTGRFAHARGTVIVDCVTLEPPHETEDTLYPSPELPGEFDLDRVTRSPRVGRAGVSRRRWCLDLHLAYDLKSGQPVQEGDQREAVLVPAGDGLGGGQGAAGVRACPGDPRPTSRRCWTRGRRRSCPSGPGTWGSVMSPPCGGCWDGWA